MTYKQRRQAKWNMWFGGIAWFVFVYAASAARHPWYWVWIGFAAIPFMQSLSAARKLYVNRGINL